MLPSNSSLMLARMRLREDNTCPGGAPCRHPALPFPLQMRGQECPRLQESILCSRWVAAGVMARVHVRHVRRIEPVQGVRIDLQAHGVPIGDNFVAPADTPVRRCPIVCIPEAHSCGAACSRILRLVTAKARPAKIETTPAVNSGPSLPPKTAEEAAMPKTGWRYWTRAGTERTGSAIFRRKQGGQNRSRCLFQPWHNHQPFDLPFLEGG